MFLISKCQHILMQVKYAQVQVSWYRHIAYCARLHARQRHLRMMLPPGCKSNRSCGWLLMSEFVHVCFLYTQIKTFYSLRYLESLGTAGGTSASKTPRSRDDSLNSSDSEYAGGASDVEERRRSSRTKVNLRHLV